MAYEYLESRPDFIVFLISLKSVRCDDCATIIFCLFQAAISSGFDKISEAFVSRQLSAFRLVADYVCLNLISCHRSSVRYCSLLLGVFLDPPLWLSLSSLS